MAITTVLFDLDGTLLPMDQDEFTTGYFKLLCKKVAYLGYEPDKLVKGIWAGISSMVKNDGSKTNEAAFWEKFSSIFGDKVYNDIPVFDEFYRNEFQNAKIFCGYNPKSEKTVKDLKKLGYRTVLATNPLFPSVATESRIRWAGLEPEDFELYTTYEHTRYCKPNIKYFQEVLSSINVPPEECIMVGNDVSEDMVAENIGMKVFLITDCMINSEKKDISVYPHGNFDDFMTFINELK